MNNMTKEQLIAEVEALESDLRLAKAELWESLGERDRLRAMGKRLQDERNTFAQELAALTPPVVRELPNRGSLDFALQEVERDRLDELREKPTNTKHRTGTESG